MNKKNKKNNVVIYSNEDKTIKLEKIMKDYRIARTVLYAHERGNQITKLDETVALLTVRGIREALIRYDGDLLSSMTGLELLQTMDKGFEKHKDEYLEKIFKSRKKVKS